jgi:hypothetical protein
VEVLALESTGVYWIPIYEGVERRGLRVANRRHAADVRAGSHERCAGLPVVAEIDGLGAACVRFGGPATRYAWSAVVRQREVAGRRTRRAW